MGDGYDATSNDVFKIVELNKSKDEVENTMEIDKMSHHQDAT